MSIQKSLFTRGRHYRVKVTFSSGLSAFTQGDIVTFERVSFSPYDDSYFYDFIDSKDGQKKVWLLNIEEPVESWRKYFEPVER